MTEYKERRLLLAAGGTGGHIWPALSFGAWIKEHHPECEVGYICGSRPLELEIYRAAGVEPTVLPMEGSPLSGGIVRSGRRIASLFSAYRTASDAIARFRPDAALLFGGYLSFPVIMACKRGGIYCAMHEQNARAGKVTRLAAKLGLDIYSGWKECLPLLPHKHLRTGVPVRDFVLLPQKEAWRKLPLAAGASVCLPPKEILDARAERVQGAALAEDMPAGPKVVVFSGSLGSQSIKEKICEIAATAEFRGWNFIIPAVAEKTERCGGNVWLLPKIWDASLLYAAADMLVLRGGGSTLTEAGVLGIPALIIPWKGATDNHQYHNALSFVSENAGLIWTGDEGTDILVSSLLRLRTMGGKGRGRGLYGQGNIICENLWSAVWSR